MSGSSITALDLRTRLSAWRLGFSVGLCLGWLVGLVVALLTTDEPSGVVVYGTAAMALVTCMTCINSRSRYCADTNMAAEIANAELRQSHERHTTTY